MIKTPTTLVLGAGASAPYGFPTGHDLLVTIVSGILYSPPAPSLRDILLKCGFTEPEMQRFATALSKSGQSSVDAFLEHRSDLMTIGKAAIAASLIPHEDPQQLHSLSDENRWYKYLFALMATDPKEFEKNDLVVITFNYDRSLERFLLDALVNSYRLDLGRALVVLGSIPIIHVYGQLGLFHPGPLEGRPYEPKVTPDAIRQCVDGIQILHEGVVDSELFKQAKQRLSESKVVCFLGFGYHPTNLLRLGFPVIRRGQLLLGTAYGLGGDEKRRAIERTSNAIRLGLGGEDALKFIREYRVFD